MKTRKLSLKEKWAILEERWVKSGQKGIESPNQVAARMAGAIKQILDQQPDAADLPVIVTGGTNMTRYIEHAILENSNIPEEAARSIKDGGMRVVTMTPDNKTGKLSVTRVVAVNPKEVS